MDVNDSIRNRFGESADLYAKSGVHSTGPDFERLVKAARLRGDERLLDLGSGPAHTGLAFAPHLAEVVALDLTAEMLEAAQKLARERGVQNLSVQQGAAEELPFPDASFDVVTARQCAHHFRDPARAACEAARVLKPGGVFLVIDSISPPDPRLDTFINAVEILRDPSHVRNHTLAQWRHMMESAGLEVKAQDHWLLRLGFEDWITRGGTPPRAVAQLRAMFDSATRELAEAFEIDAPASYDFSLPVGFSEGRR